MTTLEAVRSDTAKEWVESPVDEYVRVCREVTILQARAAELVDLIDRDGSYEDAGI